MSEEILRPGIAQGFYPERTEEREGRLDRLAHAIRGRLAGPREGSLARLRQVVRTIEELQAGIEKDSDEVLDARVRALRRELGRRGLTEDLLQAAFALVREVASRTLGTPHYGVQLMGGWVMARGMLAEMQTGEGKTLTATLPACAAALAGIPVHVISSNDYLVERDAEAMRPVYQRLGLTVGYVTENLREPTVRRAAYRCDITYGTTKQLAFDYLRDGLERGAQRGRLAMQVERLHRDEPRSERLLLRGLCFAVVDEADSVLIDEARTPLILSGSGGSADQRRTYRRAIRLARGLEDGRDYRVERRAGRIDLTEQGKARLEEQAAPLGGFWTGPRRREEWILQALAALHLFVRDRHYLVRDAKVQIIDGPTGRLEPDRSWERGLHQLIEVKEGCPVTPERETLARISYQQFFRRYLRLSGMTGTAREVAREVWSVYRLPTVTIPTRRPLLRRNLGTRVFASGDERWEAVVDRVREMHGQGRPVLVGTPSVDVSERLSERLAEADLPHQVLNARQDGEEARIIAAAGESGRITVATHMAGRGTDIGLAPGVAEAGGLHVIATQRGEARRIDRQLYGRSGRQGDPGSCEAILSLEDEPVTNYYPGWFLSALRRARQGSTPLSRRLGDALTSLPQRSEERRHVVMRRNLIDLEEYLGDLLAFSGPGE